MSRVVSFTDYEPSPRYDDVPWVSARIEEAPQSTGPWAALATFGLDPVDADPADPASRSFTTDQAQLDHGWYRVVFVDGGGAEELTAPVPSPAPNLDLTTVAKVRAALQENSEDDEQDDVIADLISDASEMIERHARRQFAPRLTPESRPFRYGTGVIDLQPFDLRALESITDYAGQEQETVLTGGYELRAAAPLYETYRWIALPDGDTAARQLIVTGLWGMERVPRDVERACILTVVTWLRRDISTFSRTYVLDEGRTERPDALPSAVVAMLKPYRRRF